MKAQFTITGEIEYTPEETKNSSKDEIIDQMIRSFREDLDDCTNLDIKITIIE